MQSAWTEVQVLGLSTAYPLAVCLVMPVAVLGRDGGGMCGL